MSRIEIEARALLAPDQRQEMLGYMATLSDFREFNRVMVDFSGGAERTHTAVLRVSEGSKMRWVNKSGGLADAVRLEETFKPTGTFVDALGSLSTLGYKRAMVSLRKIHVATNDGLEYSLRDVVTFEDPAKPVSTLLEVEALDAPAGQEHIAMQGIYSALGQRGLQPLSEAEFTDWVNDIYTHHDRQFTYSHSTAVRLQTDLLAVGFLARSLIAQ